VVAALEVHRYNGIFRHRRSCKSLKSFRHRDHTVVVIGQMAQIRNRPGLPVRVSGNKLSLHILDPPRFRKGHLSPDSSFETFLDHCLNRGRVHLVQLDERQREGAISLSGLSYIPYLRCSISRASAPSSPHCGAAFTGPSHTGTSRLRGEFTCPRPRCYGFLERRQHWWLSGEPRWGASGWTRPSSARPYFYR
jgi:hypothetical protein